MEHCGDFLSIISNGMHVSLLFYTLQKKGYLCCISLETKASYPVWNHRLGVGWGGVVGETVQRQLLHDTQASPGRSTSKGSQNTRSVA